MTTLTRERDAQASGFEAGRTHGLFTEAYGGNPYQEPEVPTWFADVATFYIAAYTEGVEDALAEPTDNA